MPKWFPLYQGRERLHTYKFANLKFALQAWSPELNGVSWFLKQFMKSNTGASYVQPGKSWQVKWP